MNARPYNLHNVRRAAEERRKAARALTEEARRTHLELAEIFEERAGLRPATIENSNVVQLRPETGRQTLPARDAEAPAPSPARARRKSTRDRSAPSAG
jgi:hypothetical protein